MITLSPLARPAASFRRCRDSGCLPSEVPEGLRGEWNTECGEWTQTCSCLDTRPGPPMPKSETGSPGQAIYIRNLRRISWLVVLSVSAVPISAATLAIQNQTIGPGQSEIAAVSFFSEGQAISALQFDLECDAALTVLLFSGAQSDASGKTLHATYLPGGSVRILVIGINRANIADGQVLRPLIRVDAQSSPGSAGIRILNPMATTADGAAVDLAPVSAVVTIQPGTIVTSAPPVGIFNSASFLPGPVSPGEIVTILGGPDLTRTSSVSFNDLSAPILYAGAGQVNAVAPMNLEPGKTVIVRIATTQPVREIPIAVAPAEPALFTVGSAGFGPGAILNEDYTLNSSASAAASGSVISLYGTGFGLLSAPTADGEIATGPVPTALPVSATIGGVRAEVFYAGAAPGLIAGAVQINVRIPAGLPPNSAAPVSLSAGPYTTPAGVTVSVR